MRYGRLHALLFVAVALSGCALFWRVAFQAESDFLYHAEFVVSAVQRGIVPVEFLYWGGVALVSGLSEDVPRVIAASVLFVSVALAFKFHMTTRLFVEWTGGERPPSKRRLLVLQLVAIGTLLLFCLPLPKMNWYLGQFPPNQWHNGSTIFCMPFALVLFLHSVRYLERAERSPFRRTTLHTVLAFLAKPSTFFAFAPVFPLLALQRFGLRRPFFRACIPVVLGMLLLVAYVGVVSNAEYAAVTEGDGDGLSFGLFEAWSGLSKNIPISVANSLLLPLLFLVAYPESLRRDLRVRYSTLMVFVGLAIFALVSETGERRFHANLIWQTIISNYLLHCAVIAAFVRAKLGGARWRWIDWLLIVVFAAGVCSGVAYLVRFVVSGSYV